MMFHFVSLSIGSRTIKRGSIGLVTGLLKSKSSFLFFSDPFCLWECQMSGPCTGCPGHCPPPDVRLLPRISGPHVQKVFLFYAGCPDVRQISGPSCLAGCPGLLPDVRAPTARRLIWFCKHLWTLQMSGYLPDVQASLLCRMSRLDPRMSGSSGSSLFCPVSKWLVMSDVRPLARMSGLPGHLHYNGHIWAHTIYIASLPTREVDHSL